MTKFALNKLITTLVLIVIIEWKFCTSLDPNIVLKQGTLVGLKVFPETSKLPVYAYLGIPYAEPPVRELRFVKPVPHKGWNRVLFARDFKPICQQPMHNIYEESNDGYRSNEEYYRKSEDCLYLNIWTPDSAFRYGNLPVLVIITGEEMSFDWVAHRASGLDLAAEGVIVVTVQYRLNIFGWFGLDKDETPSNLGLWDQNLALLWVKENIQKFGGDPNKITLLGHGSGAACAMIHLVSPQSKEIISKVILMSGTIYSPYAFEDAPSSSGPSLSEKIVANLACQSQNTKSILACMQEKSEGDLLKAFENVYKNGNFTKVLGPKIDSYLTKIEEQFIPEDPRKMIRQSMINKIPIMIGLTNNEGAFMRDQWVDLAKQGYKIFKKYVNDTIVSNILEVMSFQGQSEKQIRETINWKFFDQTPKTNVYLMNSLHKIISQTKYELPFFETIEILSSEGPIRVADSEEDKNLVFNVSSLSNSVTVKTKRKINENQLYVYSFQQEDSIDMRGRTNLFGGAAHSSDLPFLMGPSLFQQIGRRRLTQNEEKFCRKIRQMFCDFIKSSNPTPGRLYDAWHPYTQKQKYIKTLGSQHEHSALDKHQSFDFERNIELIEQLLTQSSVEIVSNPKDGRMTGASNPYTLDVEGRFIPNERQSKSHNYAAEQNNSEHFLYLTKIYSFWRILLPKIYKNFNQMGPSTLDVDKANEKTEFYENVNATPKYKHAFFSMLTLVCLLLAILCICVYILKKNREHLDTSFL